MAENASYEVSIDKVRPLVQPFLLYATTRKKDREGKGREGKYTKSQDVIFWLFVGAHTHRPIPIKFGTRIGPRNVINVSNFCNKIFRGFRSTGTYRIYRKSPRFPIDFAGHRYKVLL